jgi:hypothetical protein
VPNHADAFNHKSLFAYHERRAFGPAAVDVGQSQGVYEIALMLDPAAVLHQVGLAVSRRRVTPIGKGAHRYALLDRRADPPAAPPATPTAFPYRTQQPIDGRCADVQQRASHYRVQPQVSVPLHAFDQHRQQRFKPLAADPIGGLPQQRQGLPHRLIPPGRDR